MQGKGKSTTLVAHTEWDDLLLADVNQEQRAVLRRNPLLWRPPRDLIGFASSGHDYLRPIPGERDRIDPPIPGVSAFREQVGGVDHLPALDIPDHDLPLVCLAS